MQRLPTAGYIFTPHRPRHCSRAFQLQGVCTPNADPRDAIPDMLVRHVADIVDTTSAFWSLHLVFAGLSAS